MHDKIKKLIGDSKVYYNADETGVEVTPDEIDYYIRRHVWISTSNDDVFKCNKCNSYILKARDKTYFGYLKGIPTECFLEKDEKMIKDIII